jgi:hypothetical protein
MFKDFIAWVVEHKVAIVVANVAFLTVFFFINIPRLPFAQIALAFLIVEAFFAAVLFALKNIWFDKK